MHILAPLALMLLLSGCLYKTKEVWELETYKLNMVLKFGTSRDENFTQLQKAVEAGLILPEYANFVMKAKWQGGATDLQAQRFIDLAVDETRRRVAAAQAQSKIGAGQSAVQYM